MSHEPEHYEIKFRTTAYEAAKPYFTAIVFDYVRHNYTRRAIESVINQSISKQLMELLILTDNASEDFSNITQTFASVIVHTGLIKFGESLFLALRLARGEVVCILDNDDEWSSDKLDTLYSLYEKFPEVDFIKNEIKPISDDGDRRLGLRLRISMGIPNKTSGRFHILENKPTPNIFGRSLTHNNSSMSFRKAILLEEYDIKKVTSFHDVSIFWFSVFNCRKIAFLDKALTYYHVKDTEINNVSASKIDFQKVKDGENKILYEESFLQFVSLISDRVDKIGESYLKDMFFDFIITSKIMLNIRTNSHYSISMRDSLAFLYHGLRNRSLGKLLLLSFNTVYILFGKFPVRAIWKV